MVLNAFAVEFPDLEALQTVKLLLDHVMGLQTEVLQFELQLFNFSTQKRTLCVWINSNGETRSRFYSLESFYLSARGPPAISTGSLSAAQWLDSTSGSAIYPRPRT